MAPVAVSEFSNELLQKDWYQGCDGAVEFELHREELLRREQNGEWYAEPKMDGIWVVVFWTDRGARVFSRNGKEKASLNKAYSTLPVPPGTAIVGEAPYGSQEGARRRAQVGHEFLDAFDLLFDQGHWVGDRSALERKRYLEALVKDLDRGMRASELIRVLPTIQRGMWEAYQREPEGLVLKPSRFAVSRGLDPYCPGTRNPEWVKFKKKFTYDMVVMGVVQSTALTKAGREMAQCVVCGQFVKGISSGDAWLKYREFGVAQWWPEGPLTSGDLVLVPLARPGAMSHVWSRALYSDIQNFLGKVVIVSGYKQFESGAIRHPSLGDAEGRVLRTDKVSLSCVFRPEEA